MLEKAWRWTGRHLFSSYIFETVLKSLYKKYAFCIIKDTWSITAFSYLCANSANFQSEQNMYLPTQMLTLSMELEPTDTKVVLKLSFRCLYRGVQAEMLCHQHMLKPHWTHSRLSIFFQPKSLGLFDLKGPGSSHNRSHIFIWRFTSEGELLVDVKDAEKLQTQEKTSKGGDHFSQHWLFNSQDFETWETALQLHYRALLLWAHCKSIQNGILDKSEPFPFFLHGRKDKSLRASKADKNCIEWEQIGTEIDSLLLAPKSRVSKPHPLYEVYFEKLC